MMLYHNKEKLIEALQDFDRLSTVKAYIKKDGIDRKTIAQIMDFSFGSNICRRFHYEIPKERFRNWSWYHRSNDIIGALNRIVHQDDFDEFIYTLRDSLVNEWGDKNFRGQPTKMNDGICMKIINLIMKHMSHSVFNNNSDVIDYLHVPWDKNTLAPLRILFNEVSIDYKMPSSVSMGYVRNMEIYNTLHELISEICIESGVSRIHYEFLHWDATQ